ncbi:MAG: hypothetical protein H2045_02325 [Rhizobiales bacterium]|nr:hypothetical protein [Hyphomicrobiales bacterium]
MTQTTSTGLALFSLRVSIFLLMIVWAVLKIMAPVSYAGSTEAPGIFERFYGFSVDANTVYIVGAIQIAFLIAYLLGVFKTVTTGGVLLMNLSSLIVSYEKILAPMAERGNILFVAAIPVFGASLAHFLMRREDRFLSLGK